MGILHQNRYFLKWNFLFIYFKFKPHKTINSVKDYKRLVARLNQTCVGSKQIKLQQNCVFFIQHNTVCQTFSPRKPK